MMRSAWRTLLLTFISCAIVVGGLVFSAAQALAAGGEPMISGVYATSITEHGATLEAQIDPEGIATTYEFWVESAVCTGGSATCERSGHPHKEQEGYIAAGSGSKTVTDDVTDLLTDTYFWYWVVAENLGGTAESSHSLFETGTAPSGACSEGCIVEVPPYESKLSPGAYEASTKYAEEALAREAARQQAVKEQDEREAALAKADQPVVAATTTPPPAVTGSVSLADTGVMVQGNGVALVKLNCLGIASCRGKLTLTAKIAPKAKGKRKPARTIISTIGTVGFSIAGDETKSVKVNLNAAGRALLKADHGRCSASLAILELAPGASNTQTKTVRLVQEKTAKVKNR
jgi:hypothetical protein